MSENTDSREIARELGRRGGNATLKKHGRKHYRKIIKKRWDNERKRQADSSD